jgi:hypothetical protein
MARKDLERILAEGSDYDGVRERLAELAALASPPVSQGVEPGRSERDPEPGR